MIVLYLQEKQIPNMFV